MDGADVPSQSLKRNWDQSEALHDPNSLPHHTLARKRSASAESFRPPPTAVSASRNNNKSMEVDEHDNSGATSSSAATPSTMPSGAEQVARINQLKGKELVVGDSWYIVAKPWFRRWSSAVAAAQENSSEAQEDQDHSLSLQDVGPVDNSSLVKPHTDDLLKPPVEGIDAEFVPQEAWNLLVSWYGLKDTAIKRKVISYGSIPGGERIEFFPPLFKCFQTIESHDIPTTAFTSTPQVRLSAGSTLGDLRRAFVSDIFRVPAEALPVRFYRTSEQVAKACEDAADAAPGYAAVTPQLVADQLEPCADGPDSQTLSEAQMDEPLTCLVMDVQPYKLDSTTTSAPPLASTSQQPQSDGNAVPFSFASNKFTNSIGNNASSGGSSSGGGLQVKYKSGKEPSAQTSASSSVNNLAADKMTTRSMSGRTSDKIRGLCGLGNLGNTCFMNSALQCLSNTPELREYFETGAYKQEINRDNPLGMSGKVAVEFGHLIQKMWSGSSSYSPREFKAMIGRFRPMFIGWSQQDSQELLSFLLDGLHEDLNRIYKKPATTKPEWEGGGDLEMMQMAKESWRLFKLRNDSVIVDLFQGMYRSTVVCPDCKKVSITFDAFTSLTLPLPPKDWSADVWVMPADVNRPRYRLTLSLPAGSTIRRAKSVIAAELGLQASHLFAMESYGSKVWKAWVDDDIVTSISSDVGSSRPPSDLVTFFELPFPYEQLAMSMFREQSKTLNDATRDSQSGKVVVPVVMATKKSPQAFFGLPFVLGMTAQEATSVEAVEEAVARHIARYSKNGADFFAEATATATSDDAEGQEQQEKSAEQTPVASTSKAAEEPASQTDDKESMTHPTLPPRGTKVREKMFKLVVPEKKQRSKNVYVSNRVTDALTRENPLSLRARTKASEEGEKSVLPGTLPESTARAQDDDDEELKSRYADVTPPKPVIETGDCMLVQFSEASYKHFFSPSEALYGFETAVRAGKPPAPRRQKGSIALDACLDEFSKMEQLDAMNTWYCPACKDHKEATKQVDLWSLPDVLVIHLKRFSASRYGSRDKIGDLVDFPLEGLDLTPRVIERKMAEDLSKHNEAAVNANQLDSEPLVYDLFAVDNHFGGLGGGHYTSYARNVLDNKWYDFDDTRVSPVSPDMVKSSSAYLLFYRRRTSRPFGGKTREVLAEAKLDQQLMGDSRADESGQMDVSRNATSLDDGMQEDDDSPPNLLSGYPASTFKVASDAERSKPWSSASSSLAQGGSPSPRSSIDGDETPWNNDDFRPESSPDSSSGPETDSSEPRGPVRLFEEPDFLLEKDNFEWPRRTPSFEY